MNSVEIKSLEDVRGQVDFGIITMREDEFSAVLLRFPPQWLVIGKAHYNIAVLESRNGRSFYIAIVRTIDQGHASAQTAANALYSDLDPSCFVLIGIAGAKPEPEFTLGDVIVGTRFHDFSVTAVHPGGIEIKNAGAPIHQLVQTVAVNLPAMGGYLGDWNTEEAIGQPLPPVDLSAKNFTGNKRWKDKVRASLSRQFREVGPQRPRLVTTGALASGNALVKDPALLQRWLEDAGGRDVKGVEMELPGISEAARSVLGDRPVVPIRGFSDVVGFKRDPAWTDYACHSAASFAKAFLASELLNIEPKPKTSTGPNAVFDNPPRTRTTPKERPPVVPLELVQDLLSRGRAIIDDTQANLGENAIPNFHWNALKRWEASAIEFIDSVDDSMSNDLTRLSTVSLKGKPEILSALRSTMAVLMALAEQSDHRPKV
jgi:nucleoside phosphorylase